MRKPLILDVSLDGDDLAWKQDSLARLDTAVAWCCGPDTDGGCPLLRGESCKKIEKADGILFQLNLDIGDHRQILGMYLRQLDVPIRVVATPEQQLRWAGILSMVEVLTPPIGPAEMDAFATEVASQTD